MENIWKNCVFRTNAGYCYLNKTGLYSELVYWRGESILRAKFKLGLVEPLHDMCCAVLSHFSYVQLFATLWAVAHQAPPNMEFSRQEFLSELSFPTPGVLPNPEIEPTSPMSSALQTVLYLLSILRFNSVQFSHSVVSNSLRLLGLRHTRLPCPSPTPRVFSNSCSLSQ